LTGPAVTIEIIKKKNGGAKVKLDAGDFKKESNHGGAKV